MFLITALAFAHPDHGDAMHGNPRNRPPSTDAFRAIGPPVPTTFPDLVNGMREQVDAAEAAGTAWKVADLLVAADTLKRFAHALPVKAMSMAEEDRLVVTERTASLVAHAKALKSTIAKKDEPTLKASIAGIRTDLDALPTIVVDDRTRR